ncbi:Isotrichodermin C-15 hydroxylase [Podospora fimiseda]|uniref:Isotrichodermin C-15 hydroxylase n=1 Tax=Podospora fimiseda TaxID=252190 RepID=A0AAN7BGX7_9PEZI|nr:Isotrichodermin C-15 hydroxylase [Podospora fimiseda]
MALLALGLANILLLGITSLLLYTLAHIIYNLYFHPLAHFPGPFFMRATRLGHAILLCRGTLPFDLLSLHRKYGPIVRIAPDELAFSDPRAWKDIMGYRGSNGQEEMGKYDKFYRPIKELMMDDDIVCADKEDHALLRRTMAHGFSDKSMREQQPIIQGYVDLLIKGLRENGDKGKKKVDVAAWYNFATFDIIGDLAFGEAFGCLEKGEYHPWVKAIFNVGRTGVIFQSVVHWPFLVRGLIRLAPKRIEEERREHIELTCGMLKRRMERAGERSDLVEGLLRKADEWGLTLEKLQANSALLIIGGSETTATMLSGVTYLLMANPEALKKLTAEVRGAFKDEEEINFATVSNLPYLLACLDEGLRMYPPVAGGLPRVVPRGGASIAGHYIPENTVVAVHQWSMYHNPEHFKNPESYHPERWLNDPEFANDHKDAFQPFHVGTRNCLGRNLAYIEMRIILARVLWNFDIKIDEESMDWMSKQRIFNFWDKGPLYAYLTPVSR